LELYKQKWNDLNVLKMVIHLFKIVVSATGNSKRGV